MEGKCNCQICGKQVEMREIAVVEDNGNLKKACRDCQEKYPLAELPAG